MKIICASSLLVALLCGPAVANSEATYRVELTVGDKQVQRHTLYVTDHRCGEVSSKTPLRESFVKICAEPTDDKRIRVSVERRVRDKADESHALTTLIATSGASFDVLDAKLTIKTQ